MNELSSNDILEGLLAYGLFCERLPNILSSINFFDYCIKKAPTCDKETSYIRYDAMRNINVPRCIEIPNPVSYYSLCMSISNNWKEFQDYFYRQTYGHVYKISRIHIRKLMKRKEVFKMNYEDWHVDGTPELDLQIGAKFLVEADISSCFPSMYSHAISWAVIGKEKAKVNRNGNEWYDKLDVCTRRIKHGETKGLLIGPHASNLISEIILTRIDNVLYKKGWKYIRNIDDYKCYVESTTCAQKFIVDLSAALREYDLTLNVNKVKVRDLPKSIDGEWVSKVYNAADLVSGNMIKYKDICRYYSLIHDITLINDGNSAIINYATKVLPKDRFTTNAIEYYTKHLMHLIGIYPYLITILEKQLFEPFNTPRPIIERIVEITYSNGIATRNYDSVCYALYFAIKYNVKIGINLSTILDSKDCLTTLLGYIYLARENDKQLLTTV